MSKIIIHNNSMQEDELAISMVERVVSHGFISGEKQYCWATSFEGLGVAVYARKTRGTTHTFEVRDL